MSANELNYQVKALLEVNKCLPNTATCMLGLLDNHITWRHVGM